jgi:hypothetical protein
MDAASAIEILNKLNLVLANQAEILARLEALHARLDILSPPPQPLVRQTAVFDDDATPPPPPPQSLLVLKRQNAQLGDDSLAEPPPALPLSRQNAVPCLNHNIFGNTIWN